LVLETKTLTSQAWSNQEIVESLLLRCLTASTITWSNQEIVESKELEEGPKALRFEAIKR